MTKCHQYECCLDQVGALVFLITDKIRLEELSAEKNSSSKLTPSIFNERNLIRNSSFMTEYYDEYEEEEVNGTMEEMTHELIEDMDDMQRMMYSMKPRCFSMCEPTELFFRQVEAQILAYIQPNYCYGVTKITWLTLAIVIKLCTTEPHEFLLDKSNTSQ